MERFYTKHQIARAARPDAEVNDKIYLIKNTTSLHLTYQIRMLAYLAQTKKKILVIRLPKRSIVEPSLKAFMTEMAAAIKIERT